MPDRSTVRRRVPLRTWAAAAAAVAAVVGAALQTVAAAAPGDAGLGTAPELGAAGRDLQASFALPPLRDAAPSGAAREFAALQVGRRALQLGLDAAAARDAWQGADARLAAARSRIDSAAPAGLRSFAGTRASQLNDLLRNPAVRGVRVLSARLDVDEPVSLRRPNVWLDLGRAELRGSAPGLAYLLRIENTSNVTVEGGVFVAGRSGVLVSASRGVTLKGSRFDGLSGGGVVATDAAAAVIADAAFERLGGAAVVLHGATVDGAVLGNRIVGNRGFSNWHAGLVITDRGQAIDDDPEAYLAADRHGVREQRIDARLRGPQRNVVAFNRIAGNVSSGIYSDGGSRNVIFDNLVEGNAKEGICLDNGSTANVVAMNVIRLNGKRWGTPDAVLKLDFVDALGRLDDGSSPAKTPGISIDNAAHNIVYANQIDRNYGGGVKLVRTAYFNLIGLNVVTDNNLGANGRFHFFGIELGAAGADAPVADLDFTPSRGNVVFGNAIRGNHYAGIFTGAGSTDNDIFDNTVFGATAWALEQARPQPNPSLNNLSNLPSRNIGAGLDPKLPELSKGRFD